MAPNSIRLRLLRAAALLLLGICCSEVMAEPLQKPEWLSDRQWANPGIVYHIKKPFLKHKFFADDPGEVKDGLLQCKVQVSKEADLDQNFGPDLLVIVSTGESRNVSIRGADNEDSMWFISRLSHLTIGQKISIDVYDRDMFSNTWAGTVEITYDGKRSIRNQSGHIKVSCLVEKSDSAEKYVQHQAKQFRRYVQQFKAELIDTSPKPGNSNMSDLDLKPTIWRIEGLAAISDWNAPVVREALDSYEEIQALWVGKVHAYIERLQGHLPKVLTPVIIGDSGFEMFVKSYEYENQVIQQHLSQPGVFFWRNALNESRCVVSVSIKNISKKIEKAVFVWVNGVHINMK